MFMTSQPHKTAKTIYSRIAAAFSFEPEALVQGNSPTTHQSSKNSYLARPLSFFVTPAKTNLPPRPTGPQSSRRERTGRPSTASR
jgi:hypothetical protein